MDFTFSTEQTEMAQAARRLLEDLCAPAELRRVFDAVDERSETRWQRLAELGLFAVLAPETAGGLGLSPCDFVLLAQESGRAALPEPLAEQAGVVVPALSELPAGATLLGPAAQGHSGVAVVHGHHPYALLPPRLTHWLLYRPEGVYLVEARQVRAHAVASMDAGRRLARADITPTPAHCIATGDAAWRAGVRALNRGALYAAAQCLGLTERLLELAVAYAKERSQFGRAIGSYQALKHQLADVAVKLEFARPVVYAAAARLAHTDARTMAAVSHAKLAAGDAAELAARTALQVHGAMGYSWEVDLHFFMKRAWALAGAWGDRSFHARRVQSLLTEGAFALGADTTFEYAAEPEGNPP
jgi:alkylation response protein AidB-like acyl-CoA dehydrogenase